MIRNAILKRFDLAGQKKVESERFIM